MKVSELTNRDFREIAIFQKLVLLCIVLNVPTILMFPGLLAMQLPSGVLGLYIWAVKSVSVIVTFLLARKLYNTTMAWLLAVLMLPPLVGILFLIVLNIRATRVFRKRGVSVGLFGADMKQMTPGWLEAHPMPQTDQQS